MVKGWGPYHPIPNPGLIPDMEVNKMSTLRRRKEEEQTNKDDFSEGLKKRKEESLQRSDAIEREIENKTGEREQKRSTALEKQSQGETAYNQFTKILKAKIENAEEDSLYLNGSCLTGPEDFIKQRKFIARSRAIKDILKDRNPPNLHSGKNTNRNLNTERKTNFL